MLRKGMFQSGFCELWDILGASVFKEAGLNKGVFLYERRRIWHKGRNSHNHSHPVVTV